MNFFKKQKLFRVEIAKSCPLVRNFFDLWLYSGDGYLPSLESLKRGKFQYIPVGIQGWVIRKWGRLWFYPDTNQEGLDLFISSGQDGILILYSKIKNYCNEIKNVSDCI